MPNLSYCPPSPEQMRSTQNSEQALQLLVAQRAIYSRAKRYLSARLVGMFLIAIAAPIVGSIWPDLAVACGAVAGIWIFLGRTLLTSRQLLWIDRGAAIQEKFDLLVFEMPGDRGRENVPSPEDIEKLASGGREVRRQAKREKLRDWYPLESSSDASAAVAICQRANVSYSDSLLRTTARVWRICIAGWGAVAILVSIALDVSLGHFLLIVLLPLLPAFLDVVEFSRNYDSASHIRRTTAREIEDAVSSGTEVDASHLLVWQERIYELRRTTPLVPDIIYWAQRKANERAMNSVAAKLAG